MCLTNISLIAYMLLVVLALVITSVAFFSPGWSTLYLESNNGTVMGGVKETGIGFFDRLCPEMDGHSDTEGFKERCKEAYKNLATWEQAVLAMMSLSIVAEVACLIWSIVVLYTLCCKSMLTHPLPLLAFLAAALTAIAVLVYLLKSGETLGARPGNYSDLKDKSSVGYSLWLSILASVLMFGATVAGCIVHKVAKVSPM